MPKVISTNAVKAFAKELNLTHLIILAHDGKLSHIVSYGKTTEQAGQAADFANKLKDAVGWPKSLHTQPSRVKRLQNNIEKLKRKLKAIELLQINE